MELDIKAIKKAIELEQKYCHINVKGKTQTFSEFICSQIKQISKTQKDPLWPKLFHLFELYPFDSLNERISSIDKLIDSINTDIKKKKEKKAFQNKIITDLHDLDVTFIKGVGPRVAYFFNKVGIFNAYDLVHYFPRRHINYQQQSKIKDLKIGEEVTVFGKITSNALINTKNNLTVLNVTITDSSANLTLTYFYRVKSRKMAEHYRALFPKGAEIMVSGKVKKDGYKNCLTLDKPQHQIITDDTDSENNLNLGRIVPIYNLSEGLNPKTLRKAVYMVLNEYSHLLNNLVPDFIIKSENLMDKQTAMKEIHFPSSEEKLEEARRTLVFEELFLIQLNLMKIREENKKLFCGSSIKIKNGGLVDTFIKNLPFELTAAQNKAVYEILNDLKSQEPMQRLLQGDVGSGKTVVATILLLAAVEAGEQAAIMAPTEILAEQHYKNFVGWLTPLGLSVGIFLGKQSVKTRKEMLTSLKNGQIDVAIGTHALVQEGVEFKNLGAIVIDEQHRFGVKQRTRLKNKGQSPQMLTMTATPIPRTLALTLHGDLDLTIINEMPKGRLPIITTQITAGGRKSAYKTVHDQVMQGHQAYIVYPLIDESETITAKNATDEAKRLQEEVFPDLKIGLLHGRLSSEEKEEVMENFKNKIYDILVSTTVVEVGVDVPNATVMIIENAERFGLSQLHQLRGRVGRSSMQSYCILVNANRSNNARLEIMTQTNDGFIIAEKDLEIRGPGEFLGVRQSGLPDLLISDLTRDIKILEKARVYAQDFVEKEDIKKYPLLQKAIESNSKKEFELLESG